MRIRNYFIILVLILNTNNAMENGKNNKTGEEEEHKIEIKFEKKIK